MPPAGTGRDPYKAGMSYDRLLAHHYARRLREQMRGNPAVGRRPTAPDDPEEIAADQPVLKESINIVGAVAPAMVRHFYDLLFQYQPAMRELFPTVMDVQRDRLLKALLSLVDGYDHPDELRPMLRQLGRDHRKFGIMPGYYEPVGRALINSLRHFSGHAWTRSHEQAWMRAYRRAADIMIEAADEDRGPPYWYATVVHHELRRPDLAVVVVQPAEPYHYQAGQYTTVETPQAPRVWRPYSMATAPRSDGLLEFHVRQVPGGLVSSALVQRVHPGTRLRLGPPLGQMVNPPGSTRDVTLLAGGTGLAPMRALAEAVLAPGDGRQVRLVVSARHENDLYDLPALETMLDWSPHLSLWVVVAEGPAPVIDRVTSVTGLLPSVLGRLGEFNSRDVFVAGPPGMVSATLHQLAMAGVGEVHHDPVVAA